MYQIANRSCKLLHSAVLRAGFGVRLYCDPKLLTPTTTANWARVATQKPLQQQHADDAAMLLAQKCHSVGVSDSGSVDGVVNGAPSYRILNYSCINFGSVGTWFVSKTASAAAADLDIAGTFEGFRPDDKSRAEVQH
jgi:hypothetical protein